METKLRDRETMGFRPETDEQETLIKNAQQAAGIKMSDLLRRAVLAGLPSVMKEIQQEQHRAFLAFTNSLRDAVGAPHYGESQNKQRKTGT